MCKKKKKYRWEFGQRVNVGKTYAEYLAIEREKTKKIREENERKAKETIERLRSVRGRILPMTWRVPKLEL